jgi:hypothetical protein
LQWCGRSKSCPSVWWWFMTCSKRRGGGEPSCPRWTAAAEKQSIVAAALPTKGDGSDRVDKFHRGGGLNMRAPLGDRRDAPSGVARI